MPTWLTDWLASWSDVAAPISAMAAIITGIIAVATLAASARDSYERTRPFVVPYAKIGPTFSYGALYLVIENFGATPAHNVTVSFDPPLPEIEQRGDEQPIRDAALASILLRYEKETQVLAPGQKLVNIWTNADEERQESEKRERHEELRQENPDNVPQLPPHLAEPLAPEALTIMVSYTDPSKRDWKRAWFAPRKHSETVSLRMTDYYLDTRQHPDDGNDADVRSSKALEAATWELWH